MPTIVLQVSTIFPSGTSVGAYRLDRLVTPAPTIPAVETQAVSVNGTLTFTTLAAGNEYVAYATANGRAIEFTVNSPGIGLSGLSDVNATAVTNGQILAWNTVNQMWQVVNPERGTIGPAGVAPFTDVWGLTDTPDEETDWGPLINDAYIAGARRFVFTGPASGQRRYPFSTQLAFDASQGVVLEGESGLNWAGDSFVGTEVRTALLWKGTGTTPPISARGSSGFTMRDIGYYYDSASFTGHMFDLAAVGAMPNFVRCHISSVDEAHLTAASTINLADTIVALIDSCTLGGSQKTVVGKNAAHSNANRIHRTTFRGAGIASLFDIFDQWVIDSCTFEVQGTPAVIDGSTGATYPARFTFSNNWIGDVTGSGRPLFRSHPNNFWAAVFNGNTIRNLGGPIFDLRGGGTIAIVDNPIIESNVTTDPIVDLGDTGAGAVAFDGVTIRGNDWVCTAAEAVINRTGHNINEITGPRGAGVLQERGMVQHEHVAYPDRDTLPTVAEGAALPAGDVAIDGTDKAGQLAISTGAGATAGVAFTVTFGKPYRATPGSSLNAVNVQLTESYGNDLIDAGVTVTATSLTGFTVSFKNAPGNVNGRLMYSVVGM